MSVGETQLFTLEEIGSVDEKLVGRKIADLRHLQLAELHVTDTLVLTTREFIKYRESRVLDGEIKQQITKRLSSSQLAQARHLSVRASTPRKCIGLESQLKVENTDLNLQYAVERIYRSWFDEKPRAHRITAQLVDEDTFPAVYVQPYFDSVYSLVTCNSQTGMPTDQRNYSWNIHNTVEAFDDSDYSFLSRIELTLRRPVKVYFVRDSITKICSVADQAITATALLHAEIEYFQKGMIEPIELLMHITPDMIARAAVPTIKGGERVLKGLPLANGVASGRLVFRNSDILSFSVDPFIFALDELRPDDVPTLISSVGAISTRGGALSHLGVISRGLSKPAISLAQCSVDEARKALDTPIGVFKESEVVVVDGNNGCIARPLYYSLENQWLVSQEPNLGIVMEILAALAKSHSFATLPLATQMHFSRLRQRARDAGLLE